MSPAQYRKSQRVLEFLINHQGSLTMPPACVLDNQFIPKQQHRGLFSPPPKHSAIPTVASSSPRPEPTNLPLSPIETLNVLVGPLRSPTSDRQQQRPSTIADESPYGQRAVTMYEPEPIKDFDLNLVARPTKLTRSITLPSKRQKYGENEPTQVVHVGRNGSQASKRSGWKHIKRVSSERRLSDTTSSEPLSATTSSSSPPSESKPATSPKPSAPPRQKFLWDVSLDEEEENEPKQSQTVTQQPISSQDSLPRTSTESTPDTPTVSSSPRSLNGTKNLHQKIGNRDSVSDHSEHAEKHPIRVGSPEGGESGGFKAAMRRGTIGKLFGIHPSRRSSKDEPGTEEFESGASP
jgi:hypothetical protein